jgi:lipopolysaccharide export system protein LptA
VTCAGRAVPRVLFVAAGAVLVAAATCPPARAQGLTGSDEPIEITADSLEVLQKDNIATFTGNVDAVQGDMVLSADKLRVHYHSLGSNDAGTGGSIRRIEAEGNVFLSSPEETAQGKFGVYDVAGQWVTLEGSVVLTRDDNVVRGERLQVDLATGRSQMFAAVPSTAGGAPTQRVKAVFVPEEEPAQSPADQPAQPSTRDATPAEPSAPETSE